MGLKVFQDSEDLELGDFFPAELQEATSTVFFHIVVGIRKLASLLTSGVRAIFYAQDWDTYYCYFLPNMLEEWKTTLYNASFYEGEIINNDEEEVEMRTSKSRGS
ncbi:hypothetical protein SUGI_0485710 [Cryptomeria japonica]|nr:hypothetical protein SUGI_0485710 [Cryptomeria japonica]